MEKNLQSIDFDNSLSSNYDEIQNRTIEQLYHESIVVANNKAHNIEQWKFNPSSYLITEFLKQYNNDKVALFNFKVDGKVYTEENVIFDECIESILDDFSRNSNKKNAFTYKDDLSEQLFSIFIDYLNSNRNKEFRISNKTNITMNDLNFDTNIVKSKFSARFKNFERDLLINKYPMQSEDIDNKELRDLVFASSEVFYVTSSRYLFILTYTPTNEQYYNDKIKEINKAPEFSFLIFDREVEEYFIENFQEINLLHNNFMQFIYSSDMNQNVANAMGESSLISQHWYTKSVEKILKDHEEELKKSKDSKLLVEYIIKYILAAEIEGVDFIEVYPFDRVFVFNEAINFSNNDTQEILNLEIAEGLLESKITHNEINDKEFLGGKTRYSYEWERIKSGLEIEKFDPSKKKLKFLTSQIDKIEKENANLVWVEPYDKDIDTVINNLVNTFTSKEKKDDNILLEYQSKYVNNNIVYLYTSGANLKKQMPAIYDLQKSYIKQIKKDEADGIKNIDYEELYESDNFNFDNSKVVLFSYVPEEGNEQKGFTILLIANQDVQKATMEQKAEKDDLHTALKLLVNQHFTIDAQYKKKSEKEQKELINILSQTEHSLKNSFDEFIKDKNNFNEDSLKNFQSKVLSLIAQDRKQMEDYGRNSQEIEFNKSNINPLNNSLDFIRKTMSSSNSDKKDADTLLNRKFDNNSQKPWDIFANTIYELDIDTLKDNRIKEIKWTSTTKPKEEIKLKIDFNELQDFKFEWKESLFNDAIYVMLKNSCEHSLETMSRGDMKKEIFIDIYISNQNQQDTLNIEFTNHTKPLCKNMFEHINKGIIEKANQNKPNSTGIGVVKIRERLDVTYGLDKADINFTMVGKNKIKSKLFLPIQTIHSNEIFLSESECNHSTNILYLEDVAEYYDYNIKLLNSEKINCHHRKGNYSDIEFGEYDILLTDLHIFGDNGSNNETNGSDAIENFIKANSKGIIVILSTAEFTGDSKGLNIENNIDNIVKFNSATIYKTNIKKLNEYLVKLISQVYSNEEHNFDGTQTNSKKENTTSFQHKFKEFSLDKSKEFSNLKKINEHNDIDGVFFISNDINVLQTIEKWEEYQVVNQDGRKRFLTNSEIPNDFLTRLVIKTKLPTSNVLAAIKHEAFRRNIIFVDIDITNDNLIKVINESIGYIIPKKGTIRQLDHDIIGKMSEFGDYSETKIKSLEELKENLSSQFTVVFEEFIKSKEITSNTIESQFKLFVKELKALEDDAINKNNNLGSSLSKLEIHIRILDYLSKDDK